VKGIIPQVSPQVIVYTAEVNAVPSQVIGYSLCRIDLGDPANYTQPDWVTAKARRLGMDTSLFAFDLPAWLSWSSDVLYLATFGLALIVILLVSCLVGQSADPRAAKRKTHLAH